VNGEQVKYQREAKAYLGQIVGLMDNYFSLFPEVRMAAARDAAGKAKYDIKIGPID
jgi:hypothetical protein